MEDYTSSRSREHLPVEGYTRGRSRDHMPTEAFAPSKSRDRLPMEGYKPSRGREINRADTLNGEDVVTVGDSQAIEGQHCRFHAFLNSKYNRD